MRTRKAKKLDERINGIFAEAIYDSAMQDRNRTISLKRRYALIKKMRRLIASELARDRVRIEVVRLRRAAH